MSFPTFEDEFIASPPEHMEKYASRLKPVCAYYNPDCKICVDKEINRVEFNQVK